MPPLLMAKAGIAVPSTPLATASRSEASSTISRYAGLLSGNAPPKRPFGPWQPAQFSAYRVAKSVTCAGLSGRSAGPGRPGIRSHAVIIAKAKAVAHQRIGHGAFTL